jgi:hypothetical protein
MESTSWSLRLAFALAIASLIWAAAIAMTAPTSVVAGRAGHPMPDAAIARSGRGVRFANGGESFETGASRPSLRRGNQSSP